MTLRKLNAAISLVTTILILDHAIFFSVWMLSRCSIPNTAQAMPWILAALMVLHALLSGILLAGNRKRRAAPHKKYAKLNLSTMIQRISALTMLALLGLHFAGAASHFQPKVLHGLLHPVFFAAVLAHTAVSVSKAFVTLGVGNPKWIRRLDLLMYAVCGLTFLAGTTGFYLCLCLGVKA